jgi:hypothetical protein
VDGALTLAGIDPDTTPLHRWLGAVWAVLVQMSGLQITLDAMNKFWSDGFAGQAAGEEPDRATWGLSPEQLAAQQRLLDGFA